MYDKDPGVGYAGVREDAGTGDGGNGGAGDSDADYGQTVSDGGNGGGVAGGDGSGVAGGNGGHEQSVRGGEGGEDGEEEEREHRARSDGARPDATARDGVNAGAKRVTSGGSKAVAMWYNMFERGFTGAFVMNKKKYSGEVRGTPARGDLSLSLTHSRTRINMHSFSHSAPLDDPSFGGANVYSGITLQPQNVFLKLQCIL